MLKALSFFPKYAKVCLLCLAFTLVPQWSDANYKLTLHEFVSLIPNWEVPVNSHPTIVGDGGLAYGYFQIHAVMVQDYNRITGSNVSHEVAFDPEFSWKIAYTVLLHYSKHIHSLGYEVKIDHWLFIWNGGGGAWKRVEYPRNDQKQINLNNYRSRAYPIINQYINEQTKRRKPTQRAQEPVRWTI